MPLGSYSAAGAPSLSWAEDEGELFSPEACLWKRGRSATAGESRCEAEADKPLLQGRRSFSLRRVRRAVILGAVRPVSRRTRRGSGPLVGTPDVTTSPATAGARLSRLAVGR